MQLNFAFCYKSVQLNYYSAVVGGYVDMLHACTSKIIIILHTKYKSQVLN